MHKMNKKRIWTISLVSFFVLIVAVVLIVVFNCNKTQLTDDEIFNIIQPEIKSDCDYLAQYTYSNLTADGSCPRCLSFDQSSLEFEKIGENYYVNLTVPTKGKFRKSDLQYSFIINKEKDIVDKDVIPFNDFACFNVELPDLNSSEGQCYHTYQAWQSFLNSLREIKCSEDSDCSFVNQGSLVGICGYCLSANSTDLDYLMDLRNQYYQKECAEPTNCAQFMGSCGCSSEGTCKLIGN